MVVVFFGEKHRLSILYQKFNLCFKFQARVWLPEISQSLEVSTFLFIMQSHSEVIMSCVMRKHVFVVSKQVQHKPVCAATEDG